MRFFTKVYLVIRQLQKQDVDRKIGVFMFIFFTLAF